MKYPKIYLSPPHMTGEEKQYINEAFRSNWIAPLGTNVDNFERDMAKYVEVKYALALSSGTAAIHLALKLLNIKKGDKVFCSTLTFVASANPIIYEGGEPVFIDSEPDTWNMSPNALERAMDEAAKSNDLPKAVIVVHLFGQIAKMDEITQICSTYGVPIIEDAAEALGAEYKGKKSGTFGELSIFSFNGNKIITTSSGGMLVSNNVDLIKRAKFLASQAREPFPYYEHFEVGYNYRMSNILAGIGIAQLKVIDERVRKRREILFRYKQALSIEGIEFMPELVGTKSNRWLTALTLNNDILDVTNSELIEFLSAHNIEARHVWKPLHLQPVFKGTSYYTHHENRSVSDYLFENGLCLPSGSSLTIEEQERIINLILKMLPKKRSMTNSTDTNSVI